MTTSERGKFATMLYFWASEPHLEEIEGVFAFFEDSSLTVAQEFTHIGVLKGLMERHPDEAQGWQSAHEALFKRQESLQRITPKSRPQWAYLYFGQWLITRDLKCVDKLLDRVADGGIAGTETAECLVTWANQNVPFKVALVKARAARQRSMLIQ